ncbi:MAG: hypothetical protein IKH33_03445 [Bacteroidales bacterium]|nr:hypothetical protein [Bacteroidales bacterium]
MRLINEYSNYCQWLRQLPTSTCSNGESNCGVVHSSEAALAILWKNGLCENISNKNILLFLSLKNRLETIAFNFIPFSESIGQGNFNVSFPTMPKALTELYGILGELYDVVRTDKWWKMCFRHYPDEPLRKIRYDEKYDELFVNDSSEIKFHQLLDSCSKAVSSLPTDAEVIILSEDGRILPLAFALQVRATVSLLIQKTPFDCCSNELISEFRREMCAVPSNHRVCLMTSVSESDIHHGYLTPETTQLVYVPDGTDMDYLFLLPKVPLSQFVYDSVPNIEMSGVKYFCFSLHSTTNVFGQTVINITTSNELNKDVVLFPNNEVITPNTDTNEKDDTADINSAQSNDVKFPENETNTKDLLMV